jgi:hypothetical protein
VAAASGCDHEKLSTTALSVVADPSSDEWQQEAVHAAQFLREDVRRSVSVLDPLHAILVPCYRLAPSTTDTRFGQEPWHEWWLENQPLLAALRI